MSEPTERQVQISQRGCIVPTVDLIMSALQAMYPRRVFPKDPLSGDRVQAIGDPWRRGGTSPSGASFSGPTTGRTSTGNYFIGAAESKNDVGESQKIVWTPPTFGQEQFGAPQSVGYIVDAVTDPARPVLRPEEWLSTQPTTVTQSSQMGRLQSDVGRQLPNQGTPSSPVPGVAYGQGQRHIGYPRVAAAVRTRVVPMTATCWGSDWDDTEELGKWLQCAAETCLQGTLSHMGLTTVVTAGWTPEDEKGTRGMHYAVLINFPDTIAWPLLNERRLDSFESRITFR